MHKFPAIPPVFPLALAPLLVATGCGGTAAEGEEMPDAPPLSGIVLHDSGNLTMMDPDSGAITAEYSLPDQATDRQSFSADWTMFVWVSGSELHLAEYDHEEGGYVEFAMIEPEEATYTAEAQSFSEARFNPADDTVWLSTDISGFGQGELDLLEVSPDEPDEAPRLLESFNEEDSPGDEWSISEEGELISAPEPVEIELGIAEQSTLELTDAASVTDISLALDDGDGTRRSYDLAHMVDSNTALLYSTDSDTESSLAGTYGSVILVTLDEDRSTADIGLAAPATPHGVQFALLDPEHERLLLEVGGDQGWHETDPVSAGVPSEVDFDPETRLDANEILHWAQD